MFVILTPEILFCAATKLTKPNLFCEPDFIPDNRVPLSAFVYRRKTLILEENCGKILKNTPKNRGNPNVLYIKIAFFRGEMNDVRFPSASRSGDIEDIEICIR